MHQQLRAYLRAVGGSDWPHHLTLARLVARTLHLHRDALMQISGQATYHYHHTLSYLVPLLLLPGPAVLVTCPATQQYILHGQLPQLLEFLPIDKPVVTAPTWPDKNFQGLLLITQADWLRGMLAATPMIPSALPTVIDGLEMLETTAQAVLTVKLTPADWEELTRCFPQARQAIRDVLIKLIHEVFQYPRNPYGCYRLSRLAIERLLQLLTGLLATYSVNLPQAWQQWFMMLKTPQYHCLLANPDADYGQITLQGFPLKIQDQLQALWPRQPLVFLGQQIELDPQAPLWRQRLGLTGLEAINLAFHPARAQETLSLYLPQRFPLPNTPEFAPYLQAQLGGLLWQFQARSSRPENPWFAVVIVDDLPLREQIAANLAASFGSQVRVEAPLRSERGILICRWQYWVAQSRSFPIPQALLVVTLPIPSRENPPVAARIEFYKQQHRDWFREYLWPECLSRLAQLIAPIRNQKTLLALFDTRIIHRSYGQDVLNLLSPYEPVEISQVNALEPWLEELKLEAP
ncbi:hypothetical protein Syn6312_3745 [Synechococcus sp. PCC 6312]|nr:hypothetical protein Syn6312_3745 [Synechococcus sp. PCC 6312]